MTDAVVDKVIRKIAVIDTIHDFGKDDMIENYFVKEFIKQNTTYLTKPNSQSTYTYLDIKKMKNLEDILLEEITNYKDTQINTYDIETINKSVFDKLPNEKINFGIIIKDISNPNLLSFIVNIISKSTQDSLNKNTFTADANNIPEKLVCDIKDNGQPLIKSSLTNATIYDKGYIPKLHDECSKENYTQIFENDENNLFSVAEISTAGNEDNLLQIKLKDPNKGPVKTIDIVKKIFIENQDSNIGKFATLFSRIIKNLDEDDVYSGGGTDSLPTTNRKRKRDFTVNIDELLSHVQKTYGINTSDFIDYNAYINALFDLKRSGDQLQVHAAKKLQTPFISNDRVAIAYSYFLDNTTIRTSVHKQKDESGSKLKGGKKVVFYNFKKQDAIAVFDNKLYYQNTFNSYINTIDRYFNFITNFDNIDYGFSLSPQRMQIINSIKTFNNVKYEYEYLQNHINLNYFAKILNQNFTSTIIATQQRVVNNIYVLINVLLELVIYVNNIIIIIQDDVKNLGLYKKMKESYVNDSQSIKDDEEYINKMTILIDKIKNEKLFDRIKYVDDNSLMKFVFDDSFDNNVINFIKYINNVIYKLHNSQKSIESFSPENFNKENYVYLLDFIYDIYLKDIDYNLIDNEYLKVYLYTAKEWVDSIKNVARSGRKSNKTSISGINTFYTGQNSFYLKIPTMYNNEKFLSKIFNELNNIKDDTNYLINYDPRETQVGGETPIKQKLQLQPGSNLSLLKNKERISQKSLNSLKSNSTTNNLISSLFDYKHVKLFDDIYDNIIDSISKTNFVIKHNNADLYKDLKEKESDFVQILLTFIIHSYRKNNKFIQLLTKKSSKSSKSQGNIQLPLLKKLPNGRKYHSI